MAHARTENMKDPVAVGQMIAETAPLVVFDEDWLMHTGDHWKKTRLGSVSFKQFVNRFAVQLMGETPKKAKFAEIIHAMETAVEMPEAFEPVPGKIAFRNGVLDIASRKLEPHSPEFRNRHAMPFDFDPDIGDAVEWLKFLDTVWDGTPDLIEFLQLWIGYNLLDDTSQQRFVNLVGKTRSGKGTIAHVMTRLNGSANVAALELEGMEGAFPFEGAHGKKTLIMSETRIDRADVSTIVNRLLQITGEDIVEVKRKYKPPLPTEKLPGRITVLSNETMKLREPVIMSRMIVLPMPKSFLGKEDPKLKEKLDAELPAILNWALEGARKMLAGARLEQPESGQAARDRQADDMMGPVARFAEEMLINTSETKGDAWTANKNLYREFREWSDRRGDRLPVAHDTMIAELRKLGFEERRRGRRGTWCEVRDEIPV